MQGAVASLVREYAERREICIKELARRVVPKPMVTLLMQDSVSAGPSTWD